MSGLSSPLSLEKVCEHFAHWRQTRPHSRSRIPEQLWQEAISLSPYYSGKVICESLSLNMTSFYQKKKTAQSESGCPKFVEVQVCFEEWNSFQCSKVEFERADGLVMRLEREEGFSLSDLLTQFQANAQAPV